MTKRDKEVKDAIKQKRLKYLQEKQKDVDKIIEEKAMYHFAKALKILIQMGCALLASCGVVALVSEFTDNPYIVASIAIIVLSIIEVVIHLSGTRVALAKIKGKEQNFRVLSSLVVCVVFSFCSTFLGSNSTVSYFIKPPVLISINSIESKYDSLKKSNNNYWKAEEIFFLSQADTIHKKAKWAGVTTKDARPLELAHKKSAKNMKDSLIKHSVLISSAGLMAIKTANKQNKDIKIIHSKKVGLYSYCLKWISLIGYVLVFILMLFIEDHEVREVEYLSLDSDSESKGESATDTSTPESAKVKDKVKGDTGQSGGQSTVEEGAKGKAQSRISFVKDKFKDGDIETFDVPNKKPKIYLEKKNGEVKGYKESELKGLYKNSSESRKKELKPYLNKLQNAQSEK